MFAVAIRVELISPVSYISIIMNKLVVYAIPMMMYYSVFFLSIIFVSTKLQKQCTDVGLRLACAHNLYANGNYFHERIEKSTFEYCIARYSNTSTVYSQISAPITLYSCLVLLVFMFVLFLLTWYCSVSRI